MNSNVAPTGRVMVRVYDADGALIALQQGNNLVVAGGREACAILAGSGNPDKIVTAIAFGTSDTAVNISDTAITSAFSKSFDSVTYPSAGKVRYIGALETSENNGVTVREVGLVCDDGTLFARYVIGAIAKTSSIRIEVTWTVTF